MLHPTLNIALKAARSAGDILVRSLDFLDRIQFDAKSPNNYVSEVDRLAEKTLIDHLKQSFPHHAFLGEESGEQGDSDHIWIIDPLDGTSNFMHGIPHFSISIALSIKGKIEHGLIYDPIRQEIFSASRGQGARLNDKRIRVSGINHLNTAMIGTGIPYEKFKNLSAYLSILQELIPQVSGLRRQGSAALDLAYVAAGRYDGFFEFNLQSWDIAAGALIVKEAGGLVGDPQGGENFLSSGNIIAANPKLFKPLLQILHPFCQTS